MTPSRSHLAVTAAVLALCLAGLGASSCVKEREPAAPPELSEVDISSCAGCHTDYATLKAVHSPDTAAIGGGCGGDAPVIEPYDRVYLRPAGFAQFSASTHGKLACTVCHGGVGNTSDKNIAHSGDFIKHPSSQAATKCAPCHPTITSLFANSLHWNGWGQKSMVVQRYGGETPVAQLAGAYEQLPAQLKDGYKVNCAKCHGGCGDCHVNRPLAGGGGLLNGHAFSRTPSLVDNCVACHTSRGGHAYLGVGTGTVPDVHLAAVGHCINCHTKTELHGDGVMYDQRYEMALLPECTDCHTNLATSNAYHTAHINAMNCYTCHSQNYNNCGSCHVHGVGARVAAYMGFKIGRNPLPDVKKSPVNDAPYKYATLRRSLMAPDSWKEYGVAALPNFDVAPTYKYTSPHNIKKWTTRTQVDAGKSCYDNCHIIKEGSVYRNKELYLFNSDLESWEVAADTGIVVDGRLPASWDVQ